MQMKDCLEIQKVGSIVDKKLGWHSVHMTMRFTAIFTAVEMTELYLM